MTFWSALVLAAAMTAQAQPTDPDDEIVVVANLQDYRAALAACLARRCPTNEDVDASLALAEALVTNGDYVDARRIIRESLDRNAGQAARFPEPVSDLYRSNSRVARHLGMDGEAQRSAHEVLDALQAGLPREDHRHFTARLELVSSMISFGRYAEADAELARLRDVARAAGRDDVAQLAELRSIWVDYLRQPSDRTIRRLEGLARSSDPRRSVLAAGARRMLLQIHGERGNEAEVAALSAQFPFPHAGRRSLLYAPPYRLHQNERRTMEEGYSPGALISGKVINRSSDHFDDQWIDIAFRILPDGTVSDVEITRRGGATDWAEPLLQSIRGRRYAPSRDVTTERLERYTYTAPFEARTGSHIRQRSPRARLEYLDLTPESTSPSP